MGKVEWPWCYGWHHHGWYCNGGHPGPTCPTHPTRWTRIRYWLRGHKLPVY